MRSLFYISKQNGVQLKRKNEDVSLYIDNKGMLLADGGGAIACPFATSIYWAGTPICRYVQDFPDPNRIFGSPYECPNVIGYRSCQIYKKLRNKA